MRSFSALLVSAMAALTTAYTKPDYNQSPTGNTIAKPGLHDQVTADKPYTIEWKPSTEGPISLVLLRGPSTNVKPLTTLAESIDNSGSYEWTPSTDLEPDTTHYGLMLVVEGTGQYQYSTQFGVDNPHYHGPANATTTAGNATSTAAEDTKTGAVKYHTYYSTFEVTRTICPKCSEQATATPTAAVSKETIPVSVSSHVAETTSSTTSAPTTVATTTTAASSTADAGADADANADSSPTAPAFTGAAGRNTVGLGGVAIAAGVLAVLVF